MSRGAGAPEAVLFDMDGLLIDSEPVWFAIERTVFARLGAQREWTPTDAGRLVGKALEVSAAEMARCAGREPTPATIDEVGRWFVDEMVDRLGAGAPFKPGALALLDELGRHGVPAGLVSSSHRRLVDTVLRQLPDATMAASVAGDEVRHTKPHPAPYLQAMDLLGVAAERTVVLEDSVTGAQAGHAAGCTVVVVPDLAALPAEHEWYLVESLALLNLPRLAALLGRDRGEHVEVGGPARRQDRGEHADQG